MSDFEFSKILANASGLVYGYGPKPAHQSSVQPMIGSGEHAFTPQQIAQIRQLFGEGITVSDDAKTVKLPIIHFMYSPGFQEKFTTHAAAIVALGGAQPQGPSALTAGISAQSFRQATRNFAPEDEIASFNFHPAGAMNKHKGLVMKGQIPKDLLAKAEELGQGLIERVDVTKIKEFQGADILTNGQPDAKKIGGLMLAVASYQHGFAKSQGPFTFDNRLTHTDVERLNNPDIRQLILHKGKQLADAIANPSRQAGRDLADIVRENAVANPGGIQHVPNSGVATPPCGIGKPADAAGKCGIRQ